jgi:hypothetical protein
MRLIVVLRCMKTENRSMGLCLLGLATAALLSGCSGSPPWGGWSKEPTQAQVARALGRPETFIYFSQYEVYRRAHPREYVYQNNGAWVHREQPPADVSESALQASPTVEVVLTDGPEHGHEAVKRSYPRTPAAGDTIVAAAP